MLNLLSSFCNIFLGSEEKILPNDIIMNKSEEKVGEATQDETSIEENEPDTDDSAMSPSILSTVSKYFSGNNHHDDGDDEDDVKSPEFGSVVTTRQTRSRSSMESNDSKSHSESSANSNKQQQNNKNGHKKQNLSVDLDAKSGDTSANISERNSEYNSSHVINVDGKNKKRVIRGKRKMVDDSFDGEPSVATSQNASKKSKRCLDANDIMKSYDDNNDSQGNIESRIETEESVPTRRQLRARKTDK